MFSWNFNWSPLITSISGKLFTLCVTVTDLQLIQCPSKEINSALIELFGFFSELLIDRETCIHDNGSGLRGIHLRWFVIDV